GGGGGGSAGDGADEKRVEGGGVAINAKIIKMKLFDLLPASVQRVVYVDCDVVTQRPLGPYLDAVAREWGDVDEKAAAMMMEAAVTVEEAATAREVNKKLAVLPAGSSSSLHAPEGRAVGASPAASPSPPPPAAAVAAAASGAAAAPAAAVAGREDATAAAATAAAVAGVPSTLIIFPDAGGHTFPVCAGCDVAHSGVVALARGRSERCLQLWHDAFV
ncbi:unnamed protein product, partial [Laminaria digitata]